MSYSNAISGPNGLVVVGIPCYVKKDLDDRGIRLDKETYESISGMDRVDVDVTSEAIEEKLLRGIAMLDKTPPCLLALVDNDLNVDTLTFNENESSDVIRLSRHSNIVFVETRMGFGNIMFSNDKATKVLISRLLLSYMFKEYEEKEVYRSMHFKEFTRLLNREMQKK